MAPSPLHAGTQINAQVAGATSAIGSVQLDSQASSGTGINKADATNSITASGTGVTAGAGALAATTPGTSTASSFSGGSVRRGGGSWSRAVPSLFLHSSPRCPRQAHTTPSLVLSAAGNGLCRRAGFYWQPELDVGNDGGGYPDNKPDHERCQQRRHGECRFCCDKRRFKRYSHGEGSGK